MTEEKKPKILWLSDSPLTCTGYATVTRQVMNRVKGFEKHVIGHNYPGQSLKPGIESTDGSVINQDFTLHGTGMRPYAQDIITHKIRELQADIFGILLDTFMTMTNPPNWLLNLDLAPARTFFYFPSDGGGGLPQGCENALRKVHFPIAMAKFGQKQAWDVHKIKTDYIPHGVDTKTYFPMDKVAAKEKFGLQGKFVVGCVCRNQGRKMMDRLIKTFAIFAKDHPNAILFLHSDPQDGAAVFDIEFLIRRHGLENRRRWSGMRYFKGFDWKQMNDVYNAMDVFFLSTSGEGFGIPTVEAMACEVPVVVTDYTTTHELLVDNGTCGIPVKCDVELTGNMCVERGIMDINSAARALKTLYDNVELRGLFGRTGREKVLKYYDWDVVIPQWEKKFKLMMEA